MSRIIMFMTLIGVLALGYWGGFIHRVDVRGQSCVDKIDLADNVGLHQTPIVGMNQSLLRGSLMNRFSCIADIRMWPRFGGIEVEVIPRETVLFLSPIPTSINMLIDDDALIASVSALPKSETRFGLSREGVVVAIDGEAKGLPSVEYVGRIAAGEELPDLASIPWQSVLSEVKDTSKEIERVFVIENSMMILVRRPEPTFLFFPIEDNLLRTVKEGERMLRVLEQDKKRVTRLDLRFSRPVVRYAEKP